MSTVVWSLVKLASALWHKFCAIRWKLLWYMLCGFQEEWRACFPVLCCVHLCYVPWYGAHQCGTKSNSVNLTLRLCCVHFLRTKNLTEDSLTSHETSQKAQTTSKHHHNGYGTALPSSSVDLMSPLRWRGGQPCTYFFWGGHQMV